MALWIFYKRFAQKITTVTINVFMLKLSMPITTYKASFTERYFNCCEEKKEEKENLNRSLAVVDVKHFVLW